MPPIRVGAINARRRLKVSFPAVSIASSLPKYKNFFRFGNAASVYDSFPACIADDGCRRFERQFVLRGLAAEQNA